VIELEVIGVTARPVGHLALRCRANHGDPSAAGARTAAHGQGPGARGALRRRLELAAPEPGADEGDVRAVERRPGASAGAAGDSRRGPSRTASRQRQRAAPHEGHGRARSPRTARKHRCPALVLYGSRHAAMVAGGRMLASGLPNADVRVLSDVGHEVFVEAPTETFDALLRFLVSG